MAIINCPECNGSVSDQADKCPHCGFKIPKKSVFLTIVLVLLVGIIAFALLGKPADNNMHADKTHSLNACEDAIKPNLKNPDSADFDTANAVVTMHEDNKISVYITVRATNSFNAVVPTNYSCWVKKVNGNYEVDRIEQVNY